MNIQLQQSVQQEISGHKLDQETPARLDNTQSQVCQSDKILFWLK